MSGDYIFLSYSHKDTERIQPIIDWLENNYHVWYDKNLGAAREYNEEIADQIRNSKIVIAFFSASYMDSPYCKDEIMYARTKGVEILGVLIENVQLSEGMQLRLGRFQLLNFIKKIEYEKIVSNEHVISCQKDKTNETLLGNLKQKNKEQEIYQLPHMLFAPDFNGASVFSNCNHWKETKMGTLRVPIGLRQDIEKGEIMEASYDTAYGHQAILGSTMSGKSTLLQTILLQLMEHYAPNTVQFYMIDLGNYMLELFQYAPHVGDIMNSTNMDKIKRFFVFIENELKERIRFFRNGSFSSYTQKFGMQKPIILIVIDGFERFCDEVLINENYQNTFKMILRDGMRCGILFLLEKETARSRGLLFSMENVRMLAAIGYETVEKYEEAFGGYGYFSESIKNRIKQENFEVPGKGLIKFGKKLHLMQSALPIAVAEDYDRYDAIIEKCKRMRDQWKGVPVMSVPEIPEGFSLEYFEQLQKVKKLRETGNEMPIGLSVHSVQPVSISLSENYILPIVGDKNTGKSNLVRMFRKEITTRNWKTVLIDPKKKHVIESQDEQCMYASSKEELYMVCKALMQIIKDRIDNPVMVEPMYIMIDGLREFYKWLYSDDVKEKNIPAFINNIMEKGMKCKIHFIITTELKRSYLDFKEPVEGMNGLIKGGYKNGIFLGRNIAEDDFWFGLNYRQIKDISEFSYEPGMGILVDKAGISEENVIKIPIVQPS